MEPMLATRHQARWIHLYAGAGMGKTHLARELYERLGAERSIWISLSGHSDVDQAFKHLNDQFCVHLVCISGDDSWWHAYAHGRLSGRRLN